MNKRAFGHRAAAWMIAAALLACSGWASADPPSRVARLGYASGPVSFSPAGEDDWVEATVNRPMGTGDRLWTDARARAEVQVGGAMVHLDAQTSVAVLNLDDRTTQLQLTQGSLNLRVRRLDADEVFEIDTPNLAFELREPGDYRVDVDPDGASTTIAVRRGRGEAYGENAAYLMDAQQAMRFTGTGLRDHQPVDAPRLDDFDRWSADRGRALDNSASARYVSPDVIGYQDLDANGSWRVDPDHGNVWVPNHVAADWAPYRDGHWAWVDPWGWTWVDDAPWGFAVSHYGRWANLGSTWAWVPGPVRSRAYYAPALVVFVGGANLQLTITSGNVGGVAWFPLAPREVYRPSYAVSRGYYERVNQSNTVINTTVINNTYNTTNVTNVVYVNRRVPGAVVAVPTTTFVQSQPVSRAVVRVAPEMLASRSAVVAPPVAPTERSVRGAAAQRDKPPARVFERPVVARTAPPAPRVGFAAQQRQLTAKPGAPLDEAARRELKPAASPAPAPVVKVVAAPPATPAAIVAPTAPGAARPIAATRTEPERRGRPVEAPLPPVPPQVVPPDADRQPPAAAGDAARKPVAQPRAPVTPAAEPPATTPPSGRPERRGRPVESPLPTVPPQVVPPGADMRRPAADSGRPARPAPIAASAAPEGRAARRPSEPKVQPRAQRAEPAASRPDDSPRDRDGRQRDEAVRGPRG